MMKSKLNWLISISGYIVLMANVSAQDARIYQEGHTVAFDMTNLML